MYKFTRLLLRACRLLLRAFFTNTGCSVRILKKLNACVMFSYAQLYTELKEATFKLHGNL